MKVTPTAPPTAGNPGQNNSQQQARERAIARLSQNSPVQDQNAISPEEMGAITQQKGQNTLTEESVVVEEVTPTPVAEVETKAEPAKSESSEYLRLVRAEKALRAKQQAQEQAFKAREQALATREAELQAQAQQYKTDYIPKNTFKQSPLQALAEAGVSYEELTQQMINQQPLDPRIDSTVKSLEAKIKALEEAAETSKKSVEEQQTQAYKAAVQQIERDVQSLVKSDPNFEMVAATGSIKDVVALIEETYKDEGRLMTVEEAAQEVEDHLLEEIEKLTKIQKIQKRMQAASTPPSTPSQQQTQGSAPKQPQPAKTLTNTMASSRQLSAKERAIMAFKGELK